MLLLLAHNSYLRIVASGVASAGTMTIVSLLTSSYEVRLGGSFPRRLKDPASQPSRSPWQCVLTCMSHADAGVVTVPELKIVGDVFKWKNVFDTYDADNSGNVDRDELECELSQLSTDVRGYMFPLPLLISLVVQLLCNQ